MVDEVTRTHQADVYEMHTVDRPEMARAASMAWRVAVGKLRSMLADDQSSRSREHAIKIGMLSRLL